MSSKEVDDLKSDWLIDIANFYESLQVPIFVIEPSGDIVYANMAFAELLGYTYDHTDTLNTEQLFTSGEYPLVKKAIQEASWDSEQKNIKLPHIMCLGNDGKNIPSELDIKSLLYGEEGLLVGTINDLTIQVGLQEKEKAYEKELNQLSKMADIGRLSAGVAHELNNPLMIIQGFAENLQMMVDDSNFTHDELVGSIDPIVRSTDRMAKIITTMMNFVRDEDVEVSVCDIREVVQRSLVFTSNLVEENSVELITEFPKEECFVSCDPDQIEQVVLNITKNAVNALEENDEGNREIKITIDLSSENQIGIHFWNNGPVIPEEAQEKVLKPFYTTKAPGKGTGLGLSLSYEIMKAHGGELKLDSSDESGTEFSLVFERVAVEKTDASPSADTFLVVEDEVFVKEMIVKRLEARGYNVISAVDGQEAIDVIQSKVAVDAIFTDIRMPVKDGFELIKEVRLEDKEIPIFVISGNVTKRSLSSKAKDLNIMGAIEKPMNKSGFDELLSLYSEHKSSKLKKTA